MVILKHILKQTRELMRCMRTVVYFHKQANKQIPIALLLQQERISYAVKPFQRLAFLNLTLQKPVKLFPPRIK